MVQIGMFFVQRTDMNNMVLQKKSTQMKKASLLGVIVLGLMVIVGLFYFRSINGVDSKNAELAQEKIASSPSNDIEGQNQLKAEGSLEGSGNVGAPNGGGDRTVRALQATNINHGDTLNLRDFGVVGNGKNETAGFQKALDAAVGKVLYIPKQQASHYLTRQLRIPSNSTLVFDSQVIVQAMDDLKQGLADFEVLFRIESVNNVNIKANNALFRMNKSAYKGEHNHVFMINGSSNVIIDGAKANNSGGDGFYIGAYKTAKPLCENIQIINCSASNNRRQGLSIITAKNVLIDNGKFDKSVGADPETGIDIEPSRSTDILQGIKIKNSTASGNKRRGFLVLLNRLNASSSPVDIVFENCIAEGNMEGFSTRQTREVQGKVEYVNCIARNSRVTGFTESSSLANSVKKLYRNCIAENSNTANRKMDGYKFKANYYIAGNRTKGEVIGNSEFINCKSIVNGQAKTVDYGMVIDNGETEVENIVLNNFEARGTHGKDKLHIPQKQMRALSIK